MYTVYVQSWEGYYADGDDEKYLLYAPGLAEDNGRKKTSGYAVISPKIEKEENKAGSFTCLVPPTNPSYSKVVRGSIISVFDDGDEIFRGRILYYRRDFQKRKTLYAEGIMAFLNDVVLGPVKYSNRTSNYIFAILVSRHRILKAGNDSTAGTKGTFLVSQRPEVSGLTYDPGTTWVTPYSAIMKFVNDNQDNIGGRIRTRISNGLQYLDWVIDDRGDQVIQFGQNLLDLSEYITAEEIFTVVLPFGKDNLDIRTVNNDSRYIEDADGIAQYGRIEKMITYSDIESASELKEKAIADMNKQIADRGNISLEISAVDLHLLNVDTSRIDICKSYRVLSVPHGIDQYVVCTKISLDLQDPKRSKYTFGSNRKRLTNQVK